MVGFGIRDVGALCYGSCLRLLRELYTIKLLGSKRAESLIFALAPSLSSAAGW